MIRLHIQETAETSLTAGPHNQENTIFFNSANKPFSVYCDLQSETGFVWALIQSLSFANRATYKDKGFSTDFPVNDNNNEPDWNSYRLSLSHMQSLSNHSTHLRVTCNLPADGLQYTDWARAVLAGHDIFGDWGGECKLYEYINIRGINCSDCTAYTRMALNGLTVSKAKRKNAILMDQ